jgi:hypothetical protein
MARVLVETEFQSALALLGHNRSAWSNDDIAAAVALVVPTRRDALRTSSDQWRRETLTCALQDDRDRSAASVAAIIASRQANEAAAR